MRVLDGALGGWVAERARRRGGTLLPATLAALIVAGGTCLAIMPSVPLVILLFVMATLASAVIATVISAVVITSLPNELRGVSSGILILVAVGPGLTIGPSLVPAVSGLLGSATPLGVAIALVGVPSGIVAAFFFSRVRVDAPVRDDGDAPAASLRLSEQ